MVYVCHTAYHVFIACAKQFRQKNKECIILLSDTIPNMHQIAARLQEQKIFSQVVTLDHHEILPEFCRGSFHKTYVIAPFFLWKMGKKLSFLLRHELYLFNDYSEVGIYLMYRKKKYHLLEDSKDTFNSPHSAPGGRQRKMKNILHKVLGMPYGIGMTKYCIDMEVNNKATVRTKFNFPLVECRKDELLGAMEKAEEDQLVKIFGLPQLSDGQNKRLLVLTQPLAEMRKVKNDEETARWYGERMAPYYPEYEIYIKPHPRDKADYTRLFDGNVHLIDRTIPSEMLNYGSNTHFDLALTYSSTSINSLKCCDEVRYLA